MLGGRGGGVAVLLGSIDGRLTVFVVKGWRGIFLICDVKGTSEWGACLEGWCGVRWEENVYGCSINGF